MKPLKLNGQNLWYTSDLHLFHNNIIKYSDRRDPSTREQYTDLDSMHDQLIKNWNNVVSPENTVMILGDLAMGGSVCGPYVIDIIDQLNGKKLAVPGNHDTYTLDLDFKTLEWLPPLVEIQVDKQLIVLCHFPMLVWHHGSKGSWNLHGHCHHNLPIDTNHRRIDVGIDGPWGFRPVSHREISMIMAAHGHTQLDHH